VRRHFVVKGLAFVVLATGVLAALSFIVMSLWNALVPSLFAGPVVSFWQAAGLLVLSRTLFGGFRGRGGHGWRHRGWHGRWGRMSPEERSRVREGFLRWKDMSREERREFRGTLRSRFHGCASRIPDELAEPKETSSEV
jgi:hypothetical protein